MRSQVKVINITVKIFFLSKFYPFIRILRGVDGKFFADTLRKVRKILKMENDFSILLDIDEKKSSEKMYENQFLERMQRYKGNQTEIQIKSQDII